MNNPRLPDVLAKAKHPPLRGFMTNAKRQITAIIVPPPMER